VRRIRFQVPGNDGRPLSFPPSEGVGPFWVTGWTADEAWTLVVAYAPSVEAIKSRHNWPDAVGIDDFGEQEISFSERFPCPEWWEQTKPTPTEGETPAGGAS